MSLIRSRTRLASALVLGSLAAVLFAVPRTARVPAPDAISSEVKTTESGDLVLVQTGIFDAPVETVWKAYTTDEGWTGWASPQAKIDLRVGGELLTHYDKAGTIGDEATNRLEIVSYVPNELLTLKSDISDNWPAIMKEDADRMSNVIVFHREAPNRTRVVSYGIGYRDTPEYQSLMQFFSQANEGLMHDLKRFVETGERSAFEGY